MDDIIVDIPTLTVSDVLSVETSGAGKAGDIIVNTPTLTISDTARITATATATATNAQGGGSITLNASKMNLAGVVGVFAETQGQAPAGTLKLNPYQNQPNLDITLFPNSQISASTTASGKGGDLIITAPENINVAGNGKLAVESTGSGDAGNIQITANNLTLSDGVQISASTSASGKSGSINLNIRDNITLTGKNTGLFANTKPGSTGESGNITIDPQTFTIKNGAGIGVNSQGRGKGGNISIEAGKITLDQGFITAETTSNQGGNIHLNLQDLLLMRNNSRITASAGTDNAGGDGGNITINAPLLVAFPKENNDITANAFQGKGGNINITTNEIFGLEFRPQQTAQSDITASSELGVTGNVQINTPGVDPTSGIVELPAILVDAESLVARNICDATVIRESSFVMTGKGGLPADSQDVIANAPGLVEWVNRGDNENKVSVVVKPQQQSDIPQPINQRVIQQAQGWIVTANGQVILTAEVPKTTLQKPHFIPPSCGVTTRQ
ncbi:hemagglutination activity domain protein [Richelia sinica FACHB-800]|uniref:Hemagglutination activity domain protein n=1 Tax=Richelia sinica FACHB-800 TaxID=1357546 RepID=A0A975T3M9_9NOST|nr:S-layer family protein [Richelia sinica]QXE21573.1 hemagglutination activity domain protein [Richelia sinica FACHB-800]